MTAAFHLALGQDGADDVLERDFSRLDLDHATIDHDDVSRLQVLAEVRIVHAYRVLCGRNDLRLAAEFDGVSYLKLPWLLHIARANAGACEVHEHGDLAFGSRSSLPHPGIDRANPFMRGMAHVQPDDIGPFSDDVGEDFRAVRGRTEGAKDFRFTHGRDLSEVGI